MVRDIIHIVAQVQKTLNLDKLYAEIRQELGKMQEQTVEVKIDEEQMTLGIERPKSTAYPVSVASVIIILENLVDIENVFIDDEIFVWDYTYKRPYPNASEDEDHDEPGEVTWEGFVQLADKLGYDVNIDWVKVFTANPGFRGQTINTDNDEVGDRYAPLEECRNIAGDGKPHSVTFERCEAEHVEEIELTHVQWTIEDWRAASVIFGELIKPVSAPQGRAKVGHCYEGVDGVWYAIAHSDGFFFEPSMLGVAFQNCHAPYNWSILVQTLQFDNLPPLKYSPDDRWGNNVEAYLPLPHLRNKLCLSSAQHVTGTGVINPDLYNALVDRDRAYVLSYEGIRAYSEALIIRTINMQFPISVIEDMARVVSDRN
ncbi:hypothetical protein SPFM14_00072 [Salmonella phage SPFM14]|nr:hypothetical protein SPFM14_00072 [Salmonella phage SPFM14]